MTPDEFRRLGHQVVEWIASYREGLEQLAVMSQLAPGAIRARLPASPPEQGGGLAATLERLDEDILPGITHWNHPAFFGYFPTNTSYAAILGELAAAGLGVQGMSWQTSPAATEVEEVMLDWLRQMVALSPDFAGVIHDSASTATLSALLCARERASGFSQDRQGLQGREPPLVVYTSDQAHSSVEKAVLLAGLGRQHLRIIETDTRHALRTSRLEQAIRADLRAGLRPAAVVATVGTTATTSSDPVAGIAALCARHGMWLHVDAAMAGTAMVLPERRHLWQGIDQADSLVFNPHKWLGVGLELSAFYVRDAQTLTRVMSTSPSYLHTAHDGQVRNFRDWQIPLSRRFRALRLWFYLVDVGVAGLQARLRRDLANAAWLKERVDAAPDWERMAEVPLQTVCLRHHPPHLLHEAELARHNLAIAQRINHSGCAYLTPAVLKGQQILRISIGAEGCERRHVSALWESLQAAAAHVIRNQERSSNRDRDCAASEDIRSIS